MWYSASRVDSLLIHHRLQGCACNAPRHSKLISPHLPPLFRRRAHYTVPAAQYNRHETGTHEQALGLIPPSLCDCTGINSTLACCACHRPRGLNGSRCQQQRTYGDGDGDERGNNKHRDTANHPHSLCEQYLVWIHFATQGFGFPVLGLAVQAAAFAPQGRAGGLAGFLFHRHAFYQLGQPG